MGLCVTGWIENIDCGEWTVKLVPPRIQQGGRVKDDRRMTWEGLSIKARTVKDDRRMTH